MGSKPVCVSILAFLVIAVTPAYSVEPATNNPQHTLGAAQAKPSQAAASGKVVRVVVKTAKPFAYRDGSEWKGYSVELWKAIAQRNQWQSQWSDVETVPQMLQSVQDGNADVAVGAVSVIREREERLDFSHPFFESGLQIVTATSGAGSIWLALQGLMSAPILAGIGAIIISMLLVSWILWRLERKRNADDFPENMQPGMAEALWWSVNVLIAGGCENKTPIGTPARLVAVVWMLGGIAFTSYITAVFTSTLTVSRLNSEVRNISDLQGTLVATIAGSSSDVYLAKAGMTVDGHKTLDDAIRALSAKQVKAVVYDAPLLRYWITTHAAESTKLDFAGEPFAKQHYAYALPNGSALRKAINQSLLELRAEGFLEDLERRWFGSSSATKGS